MKSCVLLCWLLISAPAFAQMELSGEWVGKYDEDQTDRIPDQQHRPRKPNRIPMRTHSIRMLDPRITKLRNEPLHMATIPRRARSAPGSITGALKLRAIFRWRERRSRTDSVD